MKTRLKSFFLHIKTRRKSGNNNRRPENTHIETLKIFESNFGWQW